MSSTDFTATDDILDDLFSWRPPSSPPSFNNHGLSASNISINVAVANRTSVTDAKSVKPAPNNLDTSNSADSLLSLPGDLDKKLFPHQREGVQWLYRMHQHARACLLADEMGLGKTIQVSTFLGHLYRQQSIKTTVLVSPATLVPMWESALLEWGRLPRNTVEVVHGGGKAKRTARWKTLQFGLPRVMITTYGVLCRDAEAIGAGIIDYAVLDEAHTIKNHATQVHKATQMISARHKIALTGTPLMNSFNDLWTVFAFMDGDIISMSRRQFGRVNNTLLRGNERDASTALRHRADAKLAELQDAIRPFMLRREKKDLQAIRCRKHDTVVWVTLSEVQKRRYCDLLDARSHTVTTSVEERDRDATDAKKKEPENLLHLVTLLTQVCNHPWLHLTDCMLHEVLTGSPRAPAVAEKAGDILSGHKLHTALALVQRSIREDRKSLVFSRSKTLLGIFARLLTAHDVSHVRIDGDMTNTADRMKAVEAFNADNTLKTCLLTTQVGGVGLTFQAASCVILLDPSWNPAADTQAMDRVHRIGQEKEDIFTFRLITCGTIEEKIYRTQVFKSMAAKQTMHPQQSEANALFRYFTRMQLKNMFSIESLTHSATAAQLLQLHPAGVDPRVASLIDQLPNVADVSDNGCVHNETVVGGNDTAAAEPPLSGDEADSRTLMPAPNTLAQDRTVVSAPESSAPLTSKRLRSPDQCESRWDAPPPRTCDAFWTTDAHKVVEAKEAHFLSTESSPAMAAAQEPMRSAVGVAAKTAPTMPRFCDSPPPSVVEGELTPSYLSVESESADFKSCESGDDTQPSEHFPSVVIDVDDE